MFVGNRGGYKKNFYKERDPSAKGGLTVEVRNNDVNKANNVLERGRNINYRIVDELATVWCANVELLLRAKKFEEALVLIEEAITPVTGSNIKKKGNSKKRDREEASPEDDGVNKIPYCRKQLHQNQKVWNLMMEI